MNRSPRSAFPVLATLALLVLAPIGGLLSLGAASGAPADLAFWNSAYLRRAFVFSLQQAGLSTLCSVIPAILIARAFAYSGEFAGRRLILRLFAVPLVVPAVVAVLGVVAVYGSGGPIPLGRSLYGLPGILLAHVFFNLPLAVRLLLPLWQAIPTHHWQIGEQLGFGARERWWLLEWPALREGLPGVMLLIFMLCLTSFAVVLTLGGGPRSTTLEVAIYQSLRFEFEPQQAVLLALLQLLLCITLAALSLRLQKMPEVEIGLSAAPVAIPNQGRWPAFLWIGLATVFVGLPLLMLVIDALRGPLADVLGQASVWRAATISIAIGLAAAVLATLAGWALLRTSSDLARRGKTRTAQWIETGASVIYVVPPLVLGTGFFVLLSGRVNVFDWAIPLVVLVNAMMGLPFVIRTLGPAMRQHVARHEHLCQSLALGGWSRWRIVDWPLLRRPLGLSAALVCALAMGDLGVIALFGTPDTATLPLLLYQQLGAYRVGEAAVSALLLLSLCLGLFGLLERGIGGRGA